MSSSLIISAAIFGLILSGLIAFLFRFVSKRGNLLAGLVSIASGILGAVAAQQLLAGAYGPVLFGLSIVPMAAGVLVMMGLVYYVYIKVAKR